MTLLLFRILAIAVLLSYLIVCAIWKRPRTNAGKWTLRLCLANVICWVIVLPLPTTGHPPPAIITGFILWLLNLPLLVAALVALWITFKAREEDVTYVVGAIFLSRSEHPGPLDNSDNWIVLNKVIQQTRATLAS